MIDIVVADDHPLILEGVAGVFAETQFRVVARCLNGSDAHAAIRRHEPALAILDVNMPTPSGLELLTEARRDGWSTRIILLTAGMDADAVFQVARLKVDGLILKDAGAEMLIRCAEQVAAGKQWIDREVMQQVMAALATDGPAKPQEELTPREGDVVRLVALGRRNKEIARDLGITEGTVKMHLHNLYEKLSVSSRTELAILARERRLG